jgi:hypothetical protein
MSGAEAIGFAAAALQFADVGWRAALALSRLFSDLQYVPTKMKNAKRELELLLTFVEMLKSDLGLTTSGSTSILNGFITSTQRASALSLFDECIDQAQELERILTQLAPNTHKGLKRAWRAVVSVKTEHEIISRCVRLEGLKMSLNLWYGHMNLLLLKTQM